MSDVSHGKAGRGPITLDQLIALNDELLALTRAGMPLERGLVETGPDLPGRLRSVTTALGERMGQGETLSEALGSIGAGVPPVYRAVVAAGVRSGRLPFALEGLATFARGYAEARRLIGLALLYPVVVMVVAFFLLQFIAYFVMPKFEAVMYDMGVPVPWAVSLVAGFGNVFAKYAYAFLVLILALVGLWLSTRRALSLQKGRPAGVLRYFPWMGRLTEGFRAASFADLLALLLENGVPYPEALRLAGDASGDPALARSGGEVAAAIERGDPPAAVLHHHASLPPLLRWVVATGPWQGDVVSALRQMGRRYRSDARFQADKIRVLMPTVLLLTIGVTATALYASAVFGPLMTIWTSLAQPMN